MTEVAIPRGATEEETIVRRGRAKNFLRVLRANARAFASACLTSFALSACAGSSSVTISDTYCRDTFYWRTSPHDTEETRRQADVHNSRRLCKCAADCPP